MRIRKKNESSVEVFCCCLAALGGVLVPLVLYGQRWKVLGAALRLSVRLSNPQRKCVKRLSF